MDEFVARQPIFDRRLRVYAYELLPRSSPCLVHGTLHVFGFERLTSGRKALLRLSPEELASELYAALPRERTIVEVAETADPAACRRLKAAGYQMVLAEPWPAPLRPFADIFKMSDLERPPADPRRVRVLAHDVPSRDGCRRSIEAGCSYVHGEFFRKPEVLAAKDIPTSRAAYVRILQELHRPEVDFDQLAKVVHQDVALSVRLLRYLNSVALGLRKPVESVKQALVLLGEQGMRRWLSVLAIAGMGEDKPSELVANSLLRARMSELLAGPSGFDGRQYELFLTGMLSLIDVLLDRPMSEILDTLYVADAIRTALTGGPSRLTKVAALVAAYERGAWRDVSDLASHLGVPEDRLPPIHRQAVEWVEEVYRMPSSARS